MAEAVVHLSLRNFPLKLREKAAKEVLKQERALKGHVSQEAVLVTAIGLGLDMMAKVK